MYARRMLMSNALICHVCPELVRGEWTCRQDGIPIHEHAAQGACPLGKFNEAPKPATLTHGLAGLAKAALGIDRADDATIDARRATCAGCPDAVGIIGGLVTSCRLCGCIIRAKILIKGERCPANPPKW